MNSSDICAITVCIGYAQYLRVTAMHNRALFQRWVIVTSQDDLNTQNLCMELGLEMVAVAHSAPPFQAATNKAWYIDEGRRRSADHAGWYVIVDADTVVSEQVASNIGLACLSPGMLYGCWGRIFARSQDEVAWLAQRWYLAAPQAMPIIGYFQMFHSSVTTPYAKSLGSFVPGFSEAYDDVMFRHQFAPSRQALIPGYCVHLGQANTNWRGRLDSLNHVNRVRATAPSRTVDEQGSGLLLQRLISSSEGLTGHGWFPYQEMLFCDSVLAAGGTFKDGAWRIEPVAERRHNRCAAGSDKIALVCCTALDVWKICRMLEAGFAVGWDITLAGTKNASGDLLEIIAFRFGCQYLPLNEQLRNAKIETLMHAVEFVTTVVRWYEISFKGMIIGTQDLDEAVLKNIGSSSFPNVMTVWKQHYSTIQGPAFLDVTQKPGLATFTGPSWIEIPQGIQVWAMASAPQDWIANLAVQFGGLFAGFVEVPGDGSIGSEQYLSLTGGHESPYVLILGESVELRNGETLELPEDWDSRDLLTSCETYRYQDGELSRSPVVEDAICLWKQASLASAVEQWKASSAGCFQDFMWDYAGRLNWSLAFDGLKATARQKV